MEVHSQTFPYVSFMGQTLANHSYLDLSLVGEVVSGNDSFQCHTDLSIVVLGLHHGDWYFPDGNGLVFTGYIYQAHDYQRVNLHCISATSPVGIYRCEIPINAVHDDDTSVRATDYVVVYPAS